MLRRVRIAVSVFFAVLTVLMCVLWARSYWFSEHVTLLSGSKEISVGSSRGGVGVRWEPRKGNQMAPRWTYTSYYGPGQWEALLYYYADIQGGSNMASQFRWRVVERPGWPSYGNIVFPHWFVAIPLVIIAGTSGMKWLPWRFSLRALLVAVTLVALVLGLGIWLAS